MKISHFGLKRQYEALGEELLEASHNALCEGQLVDGKFTRSFEQWLKLKTGAGYAVTVNSGTQALHFIAKFWYKALSSLVNKPLVVLPNFTYPATLNAFLDAGIPIELTDTDEYGIFNLKTCNFSTKSFYKFPCIVGLYGRKPDLEYEGYFPGAIIDGAQHWLVANGDIGFGMSISFDPTKNLPASGIGGAVVTNHEDLYNYVVSQRDNGKSTEFQESGTNSKMSEQDCAQILVRTKYLDIWQQRRKLISQYYYENLQHLPVKCLDDGTAPHAHQKFVLYTNDRNALHTHLLTDGIESKIHYTYALSDLNTTKNLIKPDFLSNSVMLSRGVLSLPIYPELTDSEVEYIVEKVCDFYR